MATLDAIGAPALTPAMTYFGSRLSENITRTPEGFLICRNVPIARTGWQLYKANEIGLPGDEEVRVWRDPREVFSQAAIASGEGKPVTFRHPPVFLSPENYNAYLRGHGQFVRESDFTDSEGERLLLADLYVVDVELCNEISNGTRQISVGYSCDYEPIRGNDYRQKNIRINHFAVVKEGRAGSDVRINDAALGGEGKDGGNLPETNTNNQTANDSPVGAISVLKQTFGLFRELGLKFVPTRDEEPEAVERNKEAAEEGEKRAEKRNEDRKKRTRDDDDDDDDRRMRARDDDDDDDRRKMRDDDDDDWHRRVTDLEGKIAKLEGAGASEPGEKEEEGMEHEESEDDHDFVPVETQPKEDRPKNPIPGAPQTVDALRKLRPLIAAHGTKDDRVAFNLAMAMAKGRRLSTKDASRYGDLLHTKKPDAVRNAELNGGVAMGDEGAKPSQAGADFEDMCKKYRNKNPNEVVN